jgi:NarL family two-component system response regulator YdfI
MKELTLGNEPIPKLRDVKLTRRERQVLARFAHGLTYAEIGKKLRIRGPTVSAHLHRIRERFRINSRAALIALAIEQGLLK